MSCTLFVRSRRGASAAGSVCPESSALSEALTTKVRALDVESDFLDTVIASLTDELHEIMESADGQRYAYVSDADLCSLSIVDSNTALAVAAPMGSNMRVTSMCVPSCLPTHV
ncbi:hypothetical protein EON62_00255 [archaeon]|nr:MAG: hypothetical protein EON62_00255 [archaeon]